MIQTIKVDNLLLDYNNYRIDFPDDQIEAINQIVENQKMKLVNLAEDIAKNGLNPSDLPIVIPNEDNGIFIVVEGNRRLTAVKLLRSADLVDQLDNQSIKEQFFRLRSSYKSFSSEEVICFVVNDRAEADHWIQLRHTGDNDGIGIIKWDPKASTRFSTRMGKETYNSVGLAVLDILRDDPSISLEVKSKLDSIKITNFSRLMNDRSARSILGIHVSNGNVKVNLSDPEIKSKLEKLILEIANPEFNVRKIYYKESRLDFLNNLFSNKETSDDTDNDTDNDADNVANSANPGDSGASKASADKNPNENPTNGSAPHQNSNQNSQTGPEQDEGQDNETKERTSDNGKSNPASNYRKTLIPETTIINISYPRINDIYLELKQINIDKFNNSGAIMFRVFLELSVDQFGKRINPPGYSPKSELVNKIKSITEYMQKQKILSKDKLKGISMVVDPHTINSPLSTNSLNAYVHNADVTPIPSDIKHYWNMVEIFVIKLWE